jgi:hypothetical protein
MEAYIEEALSSYLNVRCFSPMTAQNSCNFVSVLQMSASERVLAFKMNN